MAPLRIEDLKGSPCLSLPLEDVRSSPAQVFSAAVSELRSKDWQSLPEVLWSLSAGNPAVGFELRPGGCLLYGTTPLSAISRMAPRLLELGRVYGASLSAKTDGADTALFFRSEFCVRGPASQPSVVTIPWDESARRWRYEVCTENPWR